MQDVEIRHLIQENSFLFHVKQLFFRFNEHLFQLLFKLFSWNHDTVITALTLDTDIHAHPDNFPFIRPTWVLFLHLDDVM